MQHQLETVWQFVGHFWKIMEEAVKLKAEDKAHRACNDLVYEGAASARNNAREQITAEIL